MKRSLRSNPASGNQGTYSRSTSGSDHLAFSRAANTNSRVYSHAEDQEDERSTRSSPPRQLPGQEHGFRSGRDSEDGRNSADLELPLYNKMSSSIQLGGEARRRTGPNTVVAEDVGGAGDNSQYQPPYGESVALGNESEKHPLFDNSYDDDTGKAWGSKGFGAGPGKGGRRGLPPVTTRHPTNWKEWVVYHEEWVWTGVYTLLAMLTRYWKIGWADYVVWDEVSFAAHRPTSVHLFLQAHFGKFGSHYINRDFYFDVHPPLGKMLVGLAGLLSGYNGGFEFKSGEHYPDTVPYTAMRVILATFGVGMVPVAWWTAGELGWSRQSRHLVTLCVLFGE